MAHAVERDGEIGGERGFAHPALARTDRDDPPRFAFGGEDHTDIGHFGCCTDSIADRSFHFLALARVETGNVEDHRRPPVFQRCRAYACGDRSGKRSG